MSAKPATAAQTGRKKLAQGKEHGGRPQGPTTALGHASQNTPSPEGAKEGGEVPISWRWVRLEELANVVRGSSPRPAGDPRYFGGDIPWITVGPITADNTPYLRAVPQTVTVAGKERSRFIEPGTLLLTNSGATLGVPKISLIGGCINDGVAALLDVPESLKLYLVYFLHTQTLRLRGVNQGAAQPNLNTGIIKSITVPLAPEREQRRIVAEIEKQFTRLEAGVAALRRVQANLKRYRAAVLKAACEGRLVPTEAELSRSQPSTRNSQPNYETGEQLLQRILTERRKQWTGRGQYKEPAAPKTTDLPPLPEGWTWATAQQLNLASRPCAYGVLQPGEDVPDGVPFVRVGDINNGKVELVNLKRISTTIAAQYPRTKLHGGELAITLVGAIGRTAIIPDSLAGGNTARAVGIIPLTKQVNAHWVEIWFRNPAKNAEMDSKSHEVARKTLNLEDVRIASVALPPLAEQTRIVAEVERRLSVVDELESVVSANLQRATRLRQSILQKAFTGELV